ncbi:DUF2584 family protein [Leptolyngbya sp. BL0902]|uniref:DUF2584 family protein n=1 Tax=Leptolyngbya sp. BL0902 TaxID=1115757 RepID=UPI001CEDEB04|nr:DUF2584 family protein [Leptolyngbya sp. BL0902]
MPCEVNSMLKLTPAQGYPLHLKKGGRHVVQKEGYRIIPIDVPIPLVDENWFAQADIRIYKLVWENGVTQISFEIDRVYEFPVLTKT